MDSSQLLPSLSASFLNQEHNPVGVSKTREHLDRHFGPKKELVHFILKFGSRMDFLFK